MSHFEILNIYFPMVYKIRMGKMSRISIFLVSLVLIALAANFTHGPLHPDEYFQIIEFASYKLGMSEAHLLPWEFHSKIRPWFQPAVAVIPMAFARFFGFSNATGYILIRFFFGFAMLCATWLLLYAPPQTNFDTSKSKFSCAVFFIYFVPMFAVRTSSESFCFTLLLVALSIFARAVHTNKLKFWLGTGFLFGLVFLARFQAILFFFGFLMWFWIERPTLRKKFLLVFLGFFMAFGVGILIDRWGYGVWVVSHYRYFDFNIIQDGAAKFGVEPWYFFLQSMIFKGFPQPLGGLVLLGSLLFMVKNPRHIFSYFIVFYFIGNSVLAHKEIRFVIPAVLVMALTLPGATSQILDFLKPKFIRYSVVTVLLALNFFHLFKHSFERGQDHFLYLHILGTSPDQIMCTDWNDKDPFEAVNLKIQYLKPKDKILYFSKSTCVKGTPSFKMIESSIWETSQNEKCKTLYARPYARPIIFLLGERFEFIKSALKNKQGLRIERCL